LIAVVATPHLGPVLSIIAVFLASLNVFGGYVVTGRMLAMFKPRPAAVAGDGPGQKRDDLTIRLTEDWKP
jgi:NAD/NADP transhydrogenase alpha subunit